MYTIYVFAWQDNIFSNLKDKCLVSKFEIIDTGGVDSVANHAIFNYLFK